MWAFPVIQVQKILIQAKHIARKLNVSNIITKEERNNGNSQAWRNGMVQNPPAWTFITNIDKPQVSSDLIQTSSCVSSNHNYIAKGSIEGLTVPPVLATSRGTHS